MAPSRDTPGQRLSAVAKARVIADRARQAAQALQAEYAAGKAGDTSEPEPIWRSPTEQFDALLVALRRSRPSTDAPSEAADTGDTADADAGEVGPNDEAELRAALSRVDWNHVRTVTSERTGSAAEAMRTMAHQVDWGKVQPVAAQLSSALIAAVASGQLGVGGRLGPTVARAIINQGGLGQRVAGTVNADPATRPPDFRGAIEAAAREAEFPPTTGSGASN